MCVCVCVLFLFASPSLSSCFVFLFKLAPYLPDVVWYKLSNVRSYCFHLLLVAHDTLSFWISWRTLPSSPSTSPSCECVCAKNEKSKSFFTHPRNCRVELLSFGVRYVCVCARVVFSTFYGLKEAQCVSFAFNFHFVLFRFVVFIFTCAMCDCECAGVRFKTLRADFVDSQIFLLRAFPSWVMSIIKSFYLFADYVRKWNITMHWNCGHIADPRRSPPIPATVYSRYCILFSAAKFEDYAFGLIKNGFHFTKSRMNFMAAHNDKKIYLRADGDHRGDPNLLRYSSI